MTPHPQQENGVERIVREFEEQFLPTEIIPHEIKDQKNADVALQILKHTYKTWLRTQITSLLQTIAGEVGKLRINKFLSDESVIGVGVAANNKTVREVLAIINKHITPSK